MGNTPTVCADDLLSILGVFKDTQNAKGVNNFLQRLDLDPINKKQQNNNDPGGRP